MEAKSVPTKKQLKELMQIIEDDMFRFTTELDTKPFNQRTVYVMFGRLSASVISLTSAMQYVIDHTYKDEHVAVQETPENDGRTKSSHL